jgi:hypothetical protein
METRQPTTRIGKVICAALLAIALGAGITISTPVSHTAANLLMEDSDLGGIRGRAGVETPTAGSCGSDEDSVDTSSESDDQDEPSARLIP